MKKINQPLFGLLTIFTFCYCSSQPPCNPKEYKQISFNHPSAFPFGKNKYLDEFEIKIGGKIIGHDNTTCTICLPNNQTVDTIFWRYKKNKPQDGYDFVLAKFKAGNTYSVHYNECEGLFQLHPETDSSGLIMKYRIKVTNLPKGDTLESMALFSDSTFYITDSSITDWNRVTFSANCNNSFKYFFIGKAMGIKRKCEEFDSTWCYFQADSVQQLQTLSFQQLHGENLEIYYDYNSNKVSLKLR